MRSLRALALAATALAFLVVAGAPTPASAAGEQFRFATSSMQVQEGQPMAQVVVDRVDLPVSRVVVAFHTEEGTAGAGADYVHTAGTLVFEVGATSASFAVFLRDDDVPEPSEELTLHLATASATFAPATLTIVDDDRTARTTASAAPAAGSPGSGASTAGPAGSFAAGQARAPAAPAPPAAVAPRVTRRVAAPARKRVTYRQSPVTPFELRPAEPGDVATAGPPLAVDPVVAVAAGLLLARVAAEVWFRSRSALG